MLKERAEITKTIRALAGLHKIQVQRGQRSDTGKTEIPRSNPPTMKYKTFVGSARGLSDIEQREKPANFEAIFRS
jgi:hypothetical protein